MELAQLEALCERLYNSQDSVERAHAENTLKCFSMNTEYISQCQYILDHALTPYALMLASSSLLKQVTEHTLALQLRLDISTSLFSNSSFFNDQKCQDDKIYLCNLFSCCIVGGYLINYLATRGPELQPFVTASLIQLLCRVTKFGWFDDDRFRDLVKESMDFLSQVIAFPLLILSWLMLIGIIDLCSIASWFSALKKDEMKNVL